LREAVAAAAAVAAAEAAASEAVEAVVAEAVEAVVAEDAASEAAAGAAEIAAARAVCHGEVAASARSAYAPNCPAPAHAAGPEYLNKRLVVG
jgi:hypothetical protein